MMRSLFSGVSGLKAHQTGMDTIGNNIANVNTTGFKASRTTFADTLSQTLSSSSAPGENVGGINAKQIGLGTGVASVDMIFSDGTTQSTGKNTDLALSGNGLFVVKQGNQTYYTRDGAFEFDADGNYVLPSSGLYVQGWMATNGELNTNGAVTNITIPSGKSMAPVATSIATYANNLNSAALTIASMSGGTVEKTETTSYTSSTDGTAKASINSPITLTLKVGTQTVTFQATEGSYTVGSSYDFDWTTKGDSLTASASAPVTLVLANGKNIQNLTSGTYTVGDDYSYSTTSSTTASSTNRVQLVLTGVNVSNSGTLSAKSPVLTSGTYKVGDTYSLTTSTTGDSATVSSATSVTANLKNGASIKGNTGESFTVGGTYSYTTDSVADSVITASTTVTLTLADGTTQVVTSGDYKTITSTSTSSTAVSQYGGVDITDITVESEVESLDIAAGISEVDVISEIKELRAKGTVDSMVQTTNYYGATTANPVVLTMSDGSTVTETSGTYRTGDSLPVTTTITVYDSLGNSHSVPVYFTKTITDSVNGNEWTVSISNDGLGTNTINEDDGSTTKITMADTSMRFTTDGKYDTTKNTEISFAMEITLQNGATETQNVTLNLADLTQYAGSSTINGSTNGNAAGTLSSVSIDSTGTIIGTYTNGIKQNEAKVAVAQFTNASGLTKTGNSLYEASNNSGTPNVKTAADLGCTITPSALEMSTVDISTEFSNMIITQRGFQSNSKIITVSDEMLETLINMKR